MLGSPSWKPCFLSQTFKSTGPEIPICGAPSEERLRSIVPDWAGRWILYPVFTRVWAEEIPERCQGRPENRPIRESERIQGTAREGLRTFD